MFIWRGWGISVIFCLVFWIFAVVGVALSLHGAPQTNMKALATQMDLGTALIFVLTAVSVFLLGRYRKSHPRRIVDPETQSSVFVAHVDDLYYLNLTIWAGILAAIALVFVVMAALGYSPF